MGTMPAMGAAAFMHISWEQALFLVAVPGPQKGPFPDPEAGSSS